jgi:kinesin family protein 11
MDSDESIQVVVRVRPWNDTEKAAGTVPVVHTDNHSKAVSVVRRGERVKQTKYKGFKDVLTAFTSQREVYETSVRSLVEDVLLGLSCTAFAYGETGTGKSW